MPYHAGTHVRRSDSHLFCRTSHSHDVAPPFGRASDPFRLRLTLPPTAPAVCHPPGHLTLFLLKRLYPFIVRHRPSCKQRLLILVLVLVLPFRHQHRGNLYTHTRTTHPHSHHTHSLTNRTLIPMKHKSPAEYERDGRRSQSLHTIFKQCQLPRLVHMRSPCNQCPATFPHQPYHLDPP